MRAVEFSAPTVTVGDKVWWSTRMHSLRGIAFSVLTGTILSIQGNIATIQRNGPHRPCEVAMIRLKRVEKKLSANSTTHQ